MRQLLIAYFVVLVALAVALVWLLVTRGPELHALAGRIA